MEPTPDQIDNTYTDKQLSEEEEAEWNALFLEVLGGLTDIGSIRGAAGLADAEPARAGLRDERRRWIPCALLAPGTAWLLIFFAIPMGYMLIVSLQEGNLSSGFELTWNFGIYPEVIAQYWELFVRSIGYALMTTFITLLIGYPMAYTIAFRGGRFKNILLLVVVLPFFVSFVIRTLNWRMILSDNGMVFGTLKDLGVLDQAFHFLATPASVIFGLTYNFLPFMILPLYVALEKIDRRLIEAATDLYASRLQAFLRSPSSCPCRAWWRGRC